MVFLVLYLNIAILRKKIFSARPKKKHFQKIKYALKTLEKGDVCFFQGEKKISTFMPSVEKAPPGIALNP